MPGMQSLLQISASAASKSAAAREAKKGKKHKTGNWRLYWQDTMAVYYPEAVVSYTTTDAANLKRAVNRGVPQDEVADLIEWSVKNWERVRRAASFNADKPRGPAVPDMKFLIVVIAQAHAAFRADRDAATLDLSKRRESLRGPSVHPTEPEPVSPALSVGSPPVRPLPVRPLPARPKPTDPSLVQSNIKRLGLKEWGKGK